MIIVSQDKLQIFNFKTAKDIWIEDEEVEINQIEQIVYSIYIDGEIVGAYYIDVKDTDIKTILTKESYMANCYKVGGEEC